NCGLADGHARSRAFRQVDVDAGAEADKAEALASDDLVCGLRPAHDAASNETGDLNDANWTVAGLDHEAIAFVLLARLVEIRVQELARTMLDHGDAAPDRRAVDVAGEDIHEDGDPHHLAAETKFLRREGRAYGRDDAIRRG